MEVINYDHLRLQRYSLDFVAKLPLLVKNNKGDWVRWQDVEPLLKAYLNLIDEHNNKHILRTTQFINLEV